MASWCKQKCPRLTACSECNLFSAQTIHISHLGSSSCGDLRLTSLQTDKNSFSKQIISTKRAVCCKYTFRVKYILPLLLLAFNTIATFRFIIRALLHIYHKRFFLPLFLGCNIFITYLSMSFKSWTWTLEDRFSDNVGNLQWKRDFHSRGTSTLARNNVYQLYSTWWNFLNLTFGKDTSTC